MNFEVPVKIKADAPEFIPQYKTRGAAAADIVANIPENEIALEPNQIAVVDSGFSMEISDGWEVQIRARSGLATKGLQVTNSPGTIDSDYTGRIKIILNNTSNNTIKILHKDRIAQMVIKPVWRIKWTTVNEIEKTTDRGPNGFGSTGIGE